MHIYMHICMHMHVCICICIYICIRMEAMSLSPQVRLRPPSGEVYRYAELVALLRSMHGSDESTSHRPDLNSITIHSANSSRIDMTFHELQQSPEELCVLSTRAECTSEPAARSRVVWHSFDERALNCTDTT